MTARPRCRSCGGVRLDTFYEAPGVPVHSCLLVPGRQAARDFPRRDLRLDHCTTCGFIQNSLFDPAAIRYTTDYEETQSFSPRFMAFARALCARQIERYDLRDRDVLEIGCGKGEFLALLCEMGSNRGIGIDPGYRPERAPRHLAGRLRVIPALYAEAHAHLAADYICCRHTLEHVPDVQGFVRLVRAAVGARRETVVFFEVPDVGRVLREGAFWDIYYEHCSYFTPGALARLFRACGFDLLDPYTGFEDQYLMIECRAAGGPEAPQVAAEDDRDRTALVAAFRAAVPEKIAGLRSGLTRAVQGGRTAVVWGAGSKAVAYLTALGVTDEVACVVDVNPHKQGSFLAGTGHEVVSPRALGGMAPDVVIVMNPVYREEIALTLRDLGLAPEMIVLE